MVFLIKSSYETSTVLSELILRLIAGGSGVKILIIEDEKLLVDSLTTLLRSKGFETETVHDGETGWEYASLEIYDLIIMDVKVDGLELARKLRLHRNAVPILMLMARAGALERIAGLNAGADYCLPKPFDTRELLACIHALLRRQGQQIDVLSFGNTELDLNAEVVSCNGRELRLSAREFDVLRLLMQTGDRNIPKETILSRVWGYDSNAVENHVEVYVGFLRKKLRRIGSNMRIVAIRRVGYHLEETAS
jgi:DNA-binding response OmpR family regulator